MAKILQTNDELEMIFCDIVQAITSLPESKVLSQFWSLGKPSVENNEDAAYISCSVGKTETFRNRTKSYESESFLYSQQTSRNITTHIIFYGPNSSYNAQLVLENMYTEDTKLTLEENYLFIIPDDPCPHRIPEQHNSQWYERCDLSINFNNTIQTENTVLTFKEYDIRTEVN